MNENKNTENKNENKNNRKPKTPGGGNHFLIFLIISVVATVILNVAIMSFTSPKTEEVLYSEFLEMIDNGEVEEVVIASDKIQIYKKEAEAKTTTEKLLKLWGVSDGDNREIFFAGYIPDERLLPLLDEKGKKILEARYYGIGGKKKEITTFDAAEEIKKQNSERRFYYHICCLC